MGLIFDEKKSKGVRGKEIIISADGSKVRVVIIPTNEDLTNETSCLFGLHQCKKFDVNTITSTL